MEQDKINAYMTLYTALVTVAKLAAPMIPFMADDIYRNLVCTLDSSAPESVHLCDYPVSDKALIDKELEENMDEVLKVVTIGRACRNASKVKNRQPIGNMYVKAPHKLSDMFVSIVAEELNVKNVIFKDDVSEYTSYSFKPQLRTVGPKYGKFLGGIKNALASLDGNAAMAELRENGVLRLPDVDASIELSEEDLLIELSQAEGFVADGDNTVTVVLDINLDEALIEEGFVNEIVSKLQTMRKEAGFEVMDKIKVSYQANEKVAAIFEKNADAISGQVLCNEITTEKLGGYEKEWNINGEQVALEVKKDC